MQWFEGAIPEAIAEAKHSQKVFLVYIEGNDDLSKAMSQTYNDPGISNRLKKSACVALKLEAGSASCRQFSQIYPVVVIPSSFFIGANGIPLEIVAGSLEPDAFLGKLDKVFKLHHESLKKAENSKILQPKLQSDDIPSSSSSQSHEVSAQNAQSSVKHETSPSESPESFPSTSQAVCSNSPSSAASFSSANAPKIAAASDEAAGSSSAPCLEERIERAKNLIEARRNQKAVEEVEKEKADEIKRRKLGKEMQKAKFQKQEQECKNWAQERAKEKAEEKLARERVLAQIAQDRAESALRFQMQKAEAEEEKRKKKEKLLKEEQERAAVEAAQRSKVTRIQFRMPNGTSITHQFSADATLEEARQFLQQGVRPNFPNFTMSTTFPRRLFTANDYSQTLRDLQLAPSAALLVLPVPAEAVIPQGKNMTLSFIWFMLSPFLMVWSFISNFLFGNKPSQNTSDSVSQSEDRGEKPSTSQSQNAENRPVANSRHAGETSRGGFYRREGNIYRLASQNNDDDENNTWNGNSTQQM